MRKQACMILGVSEFATDEQIKTAYKNLVKLYHPDSGNQQSSEHYTRVVQAYEYLKTHPAQAQQSYGRVLGTRSRTGSSTFSYDSVRARDLFEKEYQQRKKERKQAFNQKIKEEKKTHDDALEVIRAMQIADAIRAYLS